MKTTSVVLGFYFENFIRSTIAQGRYSNASEVVHSGLRLFEEQENKVVALKNAIEEALNSGIAAGFAPEQYCRKYSVRMAGLCVRWRLSETWTNAGYENDFENNSRK